MTFRPLVFGKKIFSAAAFLTVLLVLGCSTPEPEPTPASAESEEVSTSQLIDPAKPLGAASGRVQTASFDLTGLDCGVCRANVGRVLDLSAGVQEHKLEDTRLIVKFDDGETNAGHIKAVLESNTTSKAELLGG